jgi:hypothetical protein
MSNPILHSALLVVLGGFSMTAQAQQVYRCGKTYNQMPCPDGTAIDTRDARTQEQRVDSQKATARDTELVNRLEKARQQEAMTAAGRTPVEKKSKGKTAKSGKTKNKKINKKEPELFTATAASEKKKKKKTASPAP